MNTSHYVCCHACFSEVLSSLPLTRLDETTNFKSSFYSYFAGGLPHLQYCLWSSWSLGAMREEEDTAQRHPSHQLGAGLLLEQGGNRWLGSSSQGARTLAQRVQQGHLLVEQERRQLLSLSANSNLPSWRTSLPKMGLITSFPQAFRTLLCKAIGQEKLDALLDCRVWKHNLALYYKLSFKKRF